MYEPVVASSPSPATAIHSVSSLAQPAGSNEAESACVAFVELTRPFASGGVDAWAPGIDNRMKHASPVIVPACVTVNVPVSEPVDHLYAQPIAIVVDVAESWNSVKLPPHDENAAFVPVPVWYAIQIAISRSPEFFVSPVRLGNVRVPDVPVCTAVSTRPAATVGIVGNATGHPSRAGSGIRARRRSRRSRPPPE